MNCAGCASGSTVDGTSGEIKHLFELISGLTSGRVSLSGVFMVHNRTQVRSNIHSILINLVGGAMSLLADTQVRADSSGCAGRATFREMPGRAIETQSRRPRSRCAERPAGHLVRSDSDESGASRPVPCGRPRGTGEWGWLLSVAALTFLMVLLVGMFGIDGGRAPVPARTTVVQVGAGDTLWNIADRFAPGSDPREVVRRIVELNDLGASAARAGQSLVVPIGQS